MLLLSTIVLLGALQGIIVSGLLWVSGARRPDEQPSRRLLAILILLIALCCLDVYLTHVPAWNNSLLGKILSAVLPLIIAMPFGPLLYFYIRSCEEPDFHLTRRHRRHFYPIAIDLFQHFFLLLFLIGLITRLIPPNKYPVGIWEDYYDQYADIPRWISLTIYLTLATRYLRRRWKTEILQEEDRRRMSWLKRLLRVFWAFDLLWLAFLIPYELPKIGDELINRFDWYPLYIPLVAIIYFLGANGYFISYRTKQRSVPDKKATPMTEEKLGRLVQILRASMEKDRVWLDANLNLSKLAQHCRVAPKTLSAVLNQHLGTSFADYVNGYRIDTVKERLLMPESRQLTIAGLASECGFNSLPTFQRVFKATTGMTPSEYLYRSAAHGAAS